jgi:hypothetical protein
VRAEKREGNPAVWDVRLAPRGDGLTLTRLAFPGDRQALVVGEASASNSKDGKDSKEGSASGPR